MKKYKGYCYKVYKTDIVSRNSHTPLQYYGWSICSYNKETRKYETMEQGDYCDSKGDAVNAAIDHINEMYY
jgi:hypothetical protein